MDERWYNDTRYDRPRSPILEMITFFQDFYTSPMNGRKCKPSTKLRHAKTWNKKIYFCMQFWCYHVFVWHNLCMVPNGVIWMPHIKNVWMEIAGTMGLYTNLNLNLNLKCEKENRNISVNLVLVGLACPIILVWFHVN